MDLASLKAGDTAIYTVLHPVTGDATDFVITFAGPAHPTTIALKNDSMRRALKRARSGKSDLSPEDVESDNLAAVVRRMIGWSGLKDGGKDVPFSVDHATEILANPGYSWLRSQVNAFLAEDSSFMMGSAKTS